MFIGKRSRRISGRKTLGLLGVIIRGYVWNRLLSVLFYARGGGGGGIHRALK